jgi:glyoxylase-like metal-dependent hydrolase (beta-lactamase superfamily II)
VEAVSLTHVHIDHYGGRRGVGAGRRRPVLRPSEGARVLPNPGVIWIPASAAKGWLVELYGRSLEIPADRSVETRDGNRIAVGDTSVEVIHTPGNAGYRHYRNIS